MPAEYHSDHRPKQVFQPRLLDPRDVLAAPGEHRLDGGQEVTPVSVSRYSTCGGITAITDRTMLTYVLVHGAWHSGAACNRVAPLLTAAGHRVLMPSLRRSD